MDIEPNKKNDVPAKIEADKSILSMIETKANKTDDVKSAIDLLATSTALKQDGTVEKLVNEKTEELKNDAEARRVEAETKRIAEEVNRVKQEAEKEIAEYDKIIAAKQKEVDQLNAERDKLKAENEKAEAYFEANKDILKYIGVRSKKSMGVMKSLMYPASIVFIIVQILLFPLTFAGLTLEAVVNIVGAVCGSIKNNAFKIILSIGIILLVVGVLVCTYVFGGKLIANA